MLDTNVLIVAERSAFDLDSLGPPPAGKVAPPVSATRAAEPAPAEPTIPWRVVPFAVQGRVFGFAQSVEVAASPISAFMIAPIAQFGLIPYMQSEAGQERFGWLVGDGEARGIALVFISAGVVLLAAALLALVSRPYRRLAAAYAAAAPQEQARPPG